MKNLNYFKIVIGLFLALFITACSKDDAAIIPEPTLQDVVFNINNFIPPTVSEKGVFISGKEGEDIIAEEGLPECSDLLPSYVELSIDNGEIQTLQLVTLNDLTETEVLKLEPGGHTLTSFVVYAEDSNAIWASPEPGSYYHDLWPTLNFVDVKFDVPEFDKLKVEVDVLCYKPFKYEEFGFAWFAYAKVEIHTICFFGDVCTKFYKEFHEDGSPYYNQEFDGYDFPAIFEIIIKDGQGNIVNDDREGMNSNLSWLGTGNPLCVEYPDQLNVREIFTFEIFLLMPNGALELVYSGSFNDTAHAEVGNEEAFGGADGIFDFVVGNCSYEGNDANLELPAYLPLPKEGQFLVDDYLVNAYVDINFRNLDSTVLFENGGDGYPAYCGDINHEIQADIWFDAEFFSSLEVDTIPEHFNSYNWGALNWLANNMDDYPELTYLEIQGAIWYVIHGDPAVPKGAENNQLAQDAVLHSDFIPTVGDYAIVLVHDKNSDPASPEGSDDVQLMLVRIDP